MRKIILVFFMGFIIAPLNVYATNQIYLNCPNEVTENSEFSCLLKGTSDEEITAISAKLQCQDGVSLMSFTNVGAWQGEGINGSIDLYLADPVINEFDIGILKFKNHESSNMGIDLNSIFFYNGSTTTEVPMSNIIIKLKDDNSGSLPKDDNLNLLKDLIISNYDLKFDEKISHYKLKIKDEKQLDINPITKDIYSSYEIINNNNLTNGSQISIIVTSDQGNSIYLIDIEKNLSTDESNNRKHLNSYVYVFIIIIAILILINVLRIVKKIKNNH